MKNDKILRAIGGIDEELIERAAPKKRVRRVIFAPWLKWAMPVAACLVIAVAIAVPQLMKMNDYSGGAPESAQVNTGGAVAGAGSGDTEAGGTSAGSAPGSAGLPSPGLKLDGAIEYSASYVSPDEWRGLPTEDFVLDEQIFGGVAADRLGFRTLGDLAAHADAWVVVPNVHETAQDGKNMQTSIAEYAETIGDFIITRRWDDRTVSTGSRVLIRQKLIGGCTMDEPNNLLRVGGVYLLPLKFNQYWGAYEVIGDLDVLFELDDEGKIVSHSRFPEFSKYDGKLFSALLDDVRTLYPPPDVEFTEKPINSLEEALTQVNVAYLNIGFRKFSIEFDSLTVVRGTDAYLFKVTFGENGVNGAEYAAIAELNGAFIRGEIKIASGLGPFPQNSQTED
ncbi:hypothetical protein FACS189490_11580 [Clostridia bacterium]|nr:hypothetical protein FACS189490_11580 [Clostridia bacterium]